MVTLYFIHPTHEGAYTYNGRKYHRVTTSRPLLVTRTMERLGYHACA